MTADDRDDPNPYAPVPAGTPPPPRSLASPADRLRGRSNLVSVEEIELFLREYERRMGIEHQPQLSRRTKP